jgi:hypothetical protein
MRLFVLAAIACLVALLAPGRLFAHDLKAEVDPTSNPMRVVAGFDDGTPASGARVEVTDAAGATVASGVLDDRGVWAFSRPGPGNYRITVEQAGHSDIVKLFIPEAAPAVAVSRWRLDKNLGLAFGVILLLGGAFVYKLLRRR